MAPFGVIDVIPMRLSALLLALLCTLVARAEDDPVEKPAAPAAKPATPPPVKKKKKTSDVPPIPDSMSIVDGAKLQDAWSKSETDEKFVAEAKKIGSEGKHAKAELQTARKAAMLRADPSLKTSFIEEYLQQAKSKARDTGKVKK